MALPHGRASDTFFDRRPLRFYSVIKGKSNGYENPTVREGADLALRTVAPSLTVGFLSPQTRISCASSSGENRKSERRGAVLMFQLIGVPLRTLSARRFASGNMPIARNACGSLSSKTR